jgi:diguanylate cyclase (GGDEF)-like protein
MAVSLSLRQMLGSSTLVARMGGDEFAVALPGLDLAQTCHVGERLLAALNQTGDPARRASWSLGLAWFPAPRGAREMLEHADQALLAAKRSGGGSLRVADCSAMPGTAGAAE